VDPLRNAWPLAREVARRWRDNDGHALAAALAYYAALSFFPLLLVLIAVLGFVLRHSAHAQHARAELLAQLADQTHRSLADSIDRVLQGVQGQAGLGGPLGLALGLLGAVGVFAQLDAAINRFWRGVTPRGRGLWAALRRVLGTRLRAFLTLAALSALVWVSFLGGLVWAGLRAWTADAPLAAPLWPWLQAAAAILLNSLVFAGLFKWLPRAAVRWRHAVPVGAAVALVWELGRIGVAALIIRGNYTAYGVVGAFIVIMVWVYAASFLVLLGAQTVQTLGHPAPSQE
jgi:membrane protein